ncbi:TPA: conjugal transfer entry exclusion protein TraS [Enterobacter roggenkampii]
MISNQQILSEVEKLKALFSEGATEIPSMWSCFKPGVVAWMWLVLWPISLYSYKFLFVRTSTEVQTGITASVFLGFVAGFFMMIYIANIRAMYLSIPQSFRENSELCRFLVGKAKRYIVTYMTGYAVVIVLCTYPDYGAIYSSVLFVLASFGFMIFLNVDLNRYQLTALTSLLESIREDKGDKN